MKKLMILILFFVATISAFFQYNTTKTETEMYIDGNILTVEVETIHTPNVCPAPPPTRTVTTYKFVFSTYTVSKIEQILERNVSEKWLER